jgi:hypothetical protein
VGTFDGYRHSKTASRAALDELRHWPLSGRLKPGDRPTTELS